MMYEVRISQLAESDIRGIYEYILFSLKSPDTARGQIKRLEESILGLDQMPERFRKYEREPWLSRGMRCMVVDNYLVFYIPDNTTNTVTIIRVMYAGRNVDKQLSE